MFFLQSASGKKALKGTYSDSRRCFIFELLTPGVWAAKLKRNDMTDYLESGYWAAVISNQKDSFCFVEQKGIGMDVHALLTRLLLPSRSSPDMLYPSLGTIACGTQTRYFAARWLKPTVNGEFPTVLCICYAKEMKHPPSFQGKFEFSSG